MVPRSLNLTHSPNIFGQRVSAATAENQIPPRIVYPRPPTTGLLIPPSNVMIVYALVATNVSVGALFLAGLVPGMVTGLALMAVALVVT